MERSSLNYAYARHQPASKNLLRNSPTKHSAIYLRNVAENVVQHTNSFPCRRYFVQVSAPEKLFHRNFWAIMDPTTSSGNLEALSPISSSLQTSEQHLLGNVLCADPTPSFLFSTPSLYIFYYFLIFVDCTKY